MPLYRNCDTASRPNVRTALSAMGWARGLTHGQVLQNVPRAAGDVSWIEPAVTCALDIAGEVHPWWGHFKLSGADSQTHYSDGGEEGDKQAQGPTTPQQHPIAYA